MLKARDMMNTDVPFCDVDTPIQSLSKRFVDESMTGILVVDDEKRLLGIVTENDLIEQQGQLHIPTAITLFDMVIPLGEDKFEQELMRMQAMVAGDLMATHIQTIDVNDDLNRIAGVMSESNMHHLPVLEDDVVVGIITSQNVMKALAGRLFEQ